MGCPPDPRHRSPIYVPGFEVRAYTSNWGQRERVTWNWDRNMSWTALFRPNLLLSHPFWRNQLTFWVGVDRWWEWGVVGLWPPSGRMMTPKWWNDEPQGGGMMSPQVVEWGETVVDLPPCPWNSPKKYALEISISRKLLDMLTSSAWNLPKKYAFEISISCKLWTRWPQAHESNQNGVQALGIKILCKLLDVLTSSASNLAEMES